MKGENEGYAERIHVTSIDEHVDDLLAKVRRIDACRAQAHDHGRKFVTMNFKAAPRARDDLRILLGNLERAVGPAAAETYCDDPDRGDTNEPNSSKISASLAARHPMLLLAFLALLLQIAALLVMFSFMGAIRKSDRSDHFRDISNLKNTHLKQIDDLQSQHSERLANSQWPETPKVNALLDGLDEDDPIVKGFKRHMERLAVETDYRQAETAEELIAKRRADSDISREAMLGE